MIWYRVRLNGQNFTLNLDSEPKKYGFYTTRDVGANSFEDAKSQAIETVRNDDLLVKGTLNDETDSPMIFIDDVRELKAGEVQSENLGFTFYLEENEHS